MDEIFSLPPPAPHAAASFVSNKNTRIPTSRDDDDDSCVDLWADVASSRNKNEDRQGMNHSRCLLGPPSSRPNNKPQHLDSRSAHELSTSGNGVRMVPRRSSYISSKSCHGSNPQRRFSEHSIRPSRSQNQQRQQQQRHSTSALTHMRGDQHPVVRLSFRNGEQNPSRLYSTAGISQFEFGDGADGDSFNDTRHMMRPSVPDSYEQHNASWYQSHDEQRAPQIMQSGRSRPRVEQEPSPESNTFRRERSTLKKQARRSSMIDLYRDQSTSSPRYSSKSPRRKSDASIHSQESRSIRSANMPMHSLSNHSQESRTKAASVSSHSSQSYSRPGMLLNVSNHELFESKTLSSSFSSGLQDDSRPSFNPNSSNRSHQSMSSITSNHTEESIRSVPRRPRSSSKDYVRSQLSRSSMSNRSIGSILSSTLKHSQESRKTRPLTMISNHSHAGSRASMSNHSRESKKARPSNRTSGDIVSPHSHGDLSGPRPPGMIGGKKEPKLSPPSGHGSEERPLVLRESRSRGLFGCPSSKKREEKEEEKKKSQFLFGRFKKRQS